MACHTASAAPSTLDIRAAFALAKVYRGFELSESGRMMDAALLAASEFADRALSSGAAMSCPVLFADEPELAAAWDTGAAAHQVHRLEARFLQAVDAHLPTNANTSHYYRAKSLTWLANYAFPSASALWLRMQAEPYVLMMGCTLRVDAQGIHVGHPYGAGMAKRGLITGDATHSMRLTAAGLALDVTGEENWVAPRARDDNGARAAGNAHDA